jgi:hypothetical protein
MKGEGSIQSIIVIIKEKHREYMILRDKASPERGSPRDREQPIA